jgi:hypothetical protein
MLKWPFKRLRPKQSYGDNASLAQLRADLDAAPTDWPIDNLRLVLIPSSILSKGMWLGPFDYFPDLPVSATWAYIRPHQTMTYLSSAVARELEGRGIDWRGSGTANSRADFCRQPFTHEFRGPSGGIEAVAMFHEDGLGPSRLLCLDELLEVLPNGFDFFVPERSTALLISTTASDDIRNEILQVVQQALEVADVPMASEPFSWKILQSRLGLS